MQNFSSCLALLLFLIMYIYCHALHSKTTPMNEVTDTPANETADCKKRGEHRGGTAGSSLLDLGFLTVDMVQALASDQDAREVNLRDLTQLVTALAESVVLVDHPKEATASLNSKLSSKVIALEEKVDEQLQNLSKENDLLKKKLDLLSQKAGITAYLSTDVASTNGKTTVLKFNQIINQAGGYYDESFGTFTCPVDGEYFVSSTLKRQSSGNAATWSMTIKMGAGQQIAYASDYNSRYSTSLSTSLVVHCSALSKIWVEVTGSATISGDYNVPYSSFTANLIKPDV